MTATTYTIGQTISGTFSKLPFTGMVVGYLGDHCLKVQVENPVRGLPICLPNMLIVEPSAKNVTIDPAPAAPMTSTGIDITAFRALPAAEQAASWRAFTYETKFELCRETRKLLGRSYTSDVVDEAVAHWDAKWGTVNGQPIVAPDPAYTPLTHRIAYDPATRDYACYVQVGDDPEQYVGSAAIYHAAELKCCDYRNDLLNSALGISAAPDVVCARPAEEPEPVWHCPDCGDALYLQSPCSCGSSGAVDEPTPWAHPICPTCKRPIGQRIYDPHTGVCLDCQELFSQLDDIRTCEGLRSPCTKPVTACFHLSIGGHTSGLPLNGSLELCNEHAAEWERNNPRPTGPFCFFCPGAGHDTRDCPRVEDFESTSPSVFDPPVDHPRTLTFYPGGSFGISRPAQTILVAPDGVSELTDARCACGVELWRDELAAGVCDFCQEDIAARRVPRRLAGVSWGT
jgi:hypothetical protein